MIIARKISSLSAVWVTNEVPAGAQNGANHSFVTQYGFKPASTKLFLNGQRLYPGQSNDYIEIPESRQVVFAVAPLGDDHVLIDYERG